MTEIMQATTINNLKRARGMKLTQDRRPQGSSKGDLLQVGDTQCSCQTHQQQPVIEALRVCSTIYET